MPVPILVRMYGKGTGFVFIIRREIMPRVATLPAVFSSSSTVKHSFFTSDARKFTPVTIPFSSSPFAKEQSGKTRLNRSAYRTLPPPIYLNRIRIGLNGDLTGAGESESPLRWGVEGEGNNDDEMEKFFRDLIKLIISLINVDRKVKK